MIRVVRAALEQHGRLKTPVGSLRDHDNLHDAGFESMSMVNVMLALEEACDVVFPEAVMTRESFSSIAALAEIIQRLGARGDTGHLAAAQTAFART